MPDIKITGFAELERRMLDLPDKIAKRALTLAVAKGARVIRDEARRNARVASRTIKRKFAGKKIVINPGFLRDSIKQWVDRTRFNKYAVTYNIGVYGYKQRAKKFFAFYWRFLEFPTSRGGGQHPFLRPAFETKKQEALEAMRKYLADKISEEVSKLNG